MPSVIQQLHDKEIQGAIGWPVDGKIIVRVGCPLDNEFESEALVSRRLGRLRRLNQHAAHLARWFAAQAEAIRHSSF